MTKNILPDLNWQKIKFKKIKVSDVRIRLPLMYLQFREIVIPISIDEGKQTNVLYNRQIMPLAGIRRSAELIDFLWTNI